MKSKKNPKVNLDRKRGLFFQIGLVFAMSISLFAFEWKSADFITEIDTGISDQQFDEFVDIPITKRKEKVLPPPPPIIEIVPDEVELAKELYIEPTEMDEEDLIDIDIYSDENEEEIEFILVESKPMFLECESVSKEEQTICFEQRLIQHIQRNYKYPSIAKEMGVSEKIFVRFVIDKQGNVTKTAVVRGEDKHLRAEALRVINKLPKLKPAKQRGKPVACSFTVPINFKLK
jgi:protein TonB